MLTDAPPRKTNRAAFLESDRITTLDLPNGHVALHKVDTHKGGITLYEVVHESTHTFMLGEARQKGLFVNQVDKGAKYLSKHPDEVKLLTDYWVNTLRLLSLNIILLPMEQRIVEGA
jgi:hypothetical protein